MINVFPWTRWQDHWSNDVPLLRKTALVGSLRLMLATAAVALLAARVAAAGDETLRSLQGERAPRNLDEMWGRFDARAEPLEIEVLHQWEEDNVQLQVVRFRIGVFKGQTARLAAVYGYPLAAAREGVRVPGLLQIHGGGQYADYKACLTNARRGYATLSIAWAGRISAPDYRVSPEEVKLFWENRIDDPRYRKTTDWGAVDGYHAPGRNAGNQFPSAQPAVWTIDSIESPRNSGWFLCALAARRALTFWEQRAEVDPQRLGVYGHSMGGKLTVLTAVDDRVKAAAPSCGGISDRYNDSEVFRATLGDHVSLERIDCPILLLSPANDFHGRIGDLPSAIEEISTDEWRVVCSPHHNHQDTSEYEVATQLWMDQHLKGTFGFPETPSVTLDLNTADGIPTLTVTPDAGRPVQAVDVFYTLQGRDQETPRDREDTMNRFWHFARPARSAAGWTARLPLSSIDQPLWVFANVHYLLDEPVSGAGYYYRDYTARSFVVSSLLQKVSAEEIQDSRAQVALRRQTLIEDFTGDWQKEWFSYRPEEWAVTTHKLNTTVWAAPAGAKLVLEVQAERSNVLVVRLDDYAAEVQLAGGPALQQVILTPEDFRNYDNEPLTAWRGVRRLKLSAAEHLRPGRGQSGTARRLGATWKGTAPTFHRLRWE